LGGEAEPRFAALLAPLAAGTGSAVAGALLAELLDVLEVPDALPEVVDVLAPDADAGGDVVSSTTEIGGLSGVADTGGGGGDGAVEEAGSSEVRALVPGEKA
jgi:hypothetical protein